MYPLLRKIMTVKPIYGLNSLWVSVKCQEGMLSFQVPNAQGSPMAKETIWASGKKCRVPFREPNVGGCVLDRQFKDKFGSKTDPVRSGN